MKNPLLEMKNLPHFASIKPEHVEPAVKELLVKITKKIEEIENYQGEKSILKDLETIDLIMQAIWGPIAHLISVANSKELRVVYEKAQKDIIQLELNLAQNKKINSLLLKEKNASSFKEKSTSEQRIINKKILENNLLGISLEGAEKKAFNKVCERLNLLSTQFANNVLDAIKEFDLVLKSSAEVVGLTKLYLEMAAMAYKKKYLQDSTKVNPEKGPWLITLDAPSLIPFLENSQRQDLRKKLYEAHMNKASKQPYDNKQILEEILKLRHKKANLLDFRNYAELSLEEKMADNAKAIYLLEEELLQAAFPIAENELEKLSELARENGEKKELKHWDLSYWSKRLEEKTFGFKEEDIRPYFPIDKVLNGLFALAKKLFNISIIPAKKSPSVWHTDVMFFDVFDSKSKKQLASFFLDPYSRLESKRGGAWMNECMIRHKEESEKIVLPVAYLICNFSSPVGEKPSLLTFEEVTTLFHEFGHGLQHMLTEVDSAHCSGIRGVEWDAVELPSQFMENWCYHHDTLKDISSHYQSHEPLPDHLINSLCKKQKFLSGLHTLRQVQLGLIDLELHDHYLEKGQHPNAFLFQKSIKEKTSVLAPLKEDYSLCSFSHIFAGGYAAGYYSYKWAEVLSADAFTAFLNPKTQALENIEDTGDKFRKTVLSLGGSEHPQDVFKKFRGRKPQVNSLLYLSGLSKS